MMRRLLVTCLILICTALHRTSAITSRYITSLCPGGAGPTYGEHVMYHPIQHHGNITQSWHVPAEDLDCWLTLRGQNRLSTTAVYKLNFQLKGTYSIKGYNYGTTGKQPTGTNVTGTDCETAYIEVYNATDDGVAAATPTYGPTCGDIGFPTFETTSQSMVLHLFVAAVPEYLLTTLAPPTEAPVIVTTGDYADNITTTTIATTTTTQKALTPLERCLLVNRCPKIKFYADFTSYLAYGCYEDGIWNDNEQIYCLTTSRCIHITLLCDGQNSNNCGDWSDQVQAACVNPTRGPSPPPPMDLTPVFIGLAGGLAGLAVLLYCFWRPGYIPWRLARLRNTAFGRLVPCCRRCCRSGPCGSIGCCKPTEGKWRKFTTKFNTQTESQFPDMPPNPDRVRRPPLSERLLGKTCCFRKQGTNDQPGQLLHSGPWMNFAKGDGMHIRETR